VVKRGCLVAKTKGLYIAELTAGLLCTELKKEQFYMFKTKEELDKALVEGIITQEQYDTYLAELEAGDGGGGQPTQEELLAQLLESDSFKQVLAKERQSAEDRIRTQYSKQQKALEQEIAALKTAKMTEEERTAHELAERERIVAEKEAEIQRFKLEGHAAKVISDEKYKLTNEALPFVLAENETEIENRAHSLSQLIEKEVQKRVEAEFAKHNYVPGGTQQTGKTTKNPWTKEQWNLTEQGKLFIQDPEKAKQLAAQAGYKL